MSIGGGTKLCMPVIADVDNDGCSEILVSAGDGALHFVDGQNRGSLLGTIKQLMDKYIAAGDLSGALVSQLTNDIKQAEHKLDIGRSDQAAKHMEDFSKHLNNAGMEKNVTGTCKDVLNGYANSLVQSWLKE